MYRFHSAQMTRNSAQMTAATFAVLNKIFDDPEIPEDWKLMRDKAYAYAHLRGTASYYHAQDYANAQRHISEAVRMNPDLLANEAQPLAMYLASLANSPKNSAPLDFLESIYHHLPDSLEVLRHRQKRDLGQVAVQLAFEAYSNQDIAKAGVLMRRAIRYQPGLLANRGVVSVLVRSAIPGIRPSQPR
jgi:tetratricopeptide (TPR) repeat protein